MAKSLSETRRAGYVGFKVIGVLKLMSGLLAFVAGLGILHVVGDSEQQTLERLVTHLHFDPHSHLIHTIISRVTGIDRAHLRAIEVGTFFYATLHLIEGTGLILERDWAGYLVVIATSSLVPFEIYEIIQKFSLPRITLLILNLAVVLYLICTLRAERRRKVT